MMTVESNCVKLEKVKSWTGRFYRLYLQFAGDCEAEQAWTRCAWSRTCNKRRGTQADDAARVPEARGTEEVGYG